MARDKQYNENKELNDYLRRVDGRGPAVIFNAPQATGPAQPDLRTAVFNQKDSVPGEVFEAIRSVDITRGNAGSARISDDIYGDRVRLHITALSGEQAYRDYVANYEKTSRLAAAVATNQGAGVSSRYATSGPIFTTDEAGRIALQDFTIDRLPGGFSLKFLADSNDPLIFKDGIDVTELIRSGRAHEL